MRMILVTVLALVAFCSSACAKGPDCDAKCQALRSKTTTGLKPVVPNQICVVAPYTVDGKVELILYRNDKSIRRRLHRYFNHATSPDATFCLGPQWFDNETAWVELCDEVNTSVRGQASISEARETRVLYMCLLGEQCERYIERK